MNGDPAGGDSPPSLRETPVASFQTPASTILIQAMHYAKARYKQTCVFRYTHPFMLTIKFISV